MYVRKIVIREDFMAGAVKKNITKNTAGKTAKARANSSMRGSAGAKRSGGSSSRAGSSSKAKAAGKGPKVVTAEDMEARRKLTTEILGWCGVISFVILCLSNLNLAGKFGEVLKSVMQGMFGVLCYVFPFALAVALIYVAVNNFEKTIVKIRVFSGMAMFVFLDAFIQCIYNVPEVTNAGITDFYKVSAESGFGGGFVGGLICKALSPLGMVGSIVLLLILMIASIALFLGKRFIKENILGRLSDVSEDYDDDEAEDERLTELQRERARARREYKKQQALTREAKQKEKAELKAKREFEKRKRIRARQLNQKFVGIGDTTLIPPPVPVDQNLHELQPVEDVSAAGFGEAGGDSDSAFDLVSDYSESEHSDGAFDFEGADSGDALPNAYEAPIEDGEPEIPFAEEPGTGANAEEAEPARVGAFAAGSPVKASVDANGTAGEGGAAPMKPVKKPKPYQFPPVSLLNHVKSNGGSSNNEKAATANRLQKTLGTFGVKVEIKNISSGPAVTRYELKPELGVKVSKIVSLSDDIKMSLAATDIRIEAPVPGKDVIGIEVPNKEPSAVSMRELVDTEAFRKAKSPISFTVGKDIAGEPVVADIAKMPHLLIAGATGSGKSVCINTMIMSILYHASPEAVKMIMIDPKVVELSVYNGIPHLLCPVVTDPKKAAGTLNWAVAEMDSRYKKFAKAGAKNLADYNAKVKTMEVPESEERPEAMPQMLIIIDELADLMMVASNEVETAICRLAQLARAAGIHLVIATQRPSVNVITGLIKANVPSRIAFAVSSGVDSRTIIDMNGAEKLLGKGDMLFFPAGFPKPKRVQGAFVSDDEVSKVVDFIRKNNEAASEEEVQAVETGIANSVSSGAPGSAGGAEDEARDSYFAEAGKFIIQKERASIGMLQRNFRIGFNRAGRIMDQLGEAGVVGPEVGTKPRKVLMNEEEFDEYLRNNS